MCGHFTVAGGNILSRGLASWRNVTGPIDHFCPGDGSYAPCPCSGYGATPHGCPNSIDSFGGFLTTTGATSDNTLTFLATHLTPNGAGLLFQGDDVSLNAPYAPTGNPLFGDGLRCVMGNILRMYTKTASAGALSAPEPGDPAVRVRANLLGDPLPSGSVRYYQLWYRDPSLTFCQPQTWNTTNGVRVVW